MGAGGILPGNFPVDLVLFGMIAAFLVLRLRSILGRRQGFERTAAPPAPPVRPAVAAAPVIDGVAERPPSRALPDPASPAGQAMARMQRLDRSFSAARFLDGAETAFRMIVTAFAAGQRDALRPLLAEDMLAAFTAAITARETAGETQRSDIRGIEVATIEAADLRGSVADITVRFVSDQVTLTTGRDGAIVAGTDAVTEIVDLWTFERDLGTADPTWRLVAARSA